MAQEWLNKCFVVLNETHPKLHPSEIEKFYFFTPRDWVLTFGPHQPTPPPWLLKRFLVKGVLSSGWLVVKKRNWPSDNPRLVNIPMGRGRPRMPTIVEGEDDEFHRL